MENMNMALVSSSSSPPKLFLLGHTKTNKNPMYTLKTPTKVFTFPTSRIAPRRSRFSCSAHATPPRSLTQIVFRKFRDERFASISSSSNQQTSSVGTNPYPTVPPPSSQIGSPLFWIGVGVGLSALFTWVASSLKKYAMQQAFKTMMGQMNTQNNQFGNAAFPSGSPFPFPTPPSQGPVTPPPPPSQSRVTVDVPATKVEAAPKTDPVTEGKSETETAEPKKYAFVDVSPEESIQKNAFEDVAELNSSDNAQIPKDVSDNGAASKQDSGAFGGYQSTARAGPGLSVDALEKMMEDPTVQKMVYPYLPEEMRNPETFKWMLQNPQYRQQLQDMLERGL